MQISGKYENLYLYNVEDLLDVQDAQLDKYRQELSLSIIFSNLAISNSKQGGPPNRGGISHNRGQGYLHHGRGRGRGNSPSTGNMPTCQLCGKYCLAILDCWHQFDEGFFPNTNTRQAP